MRAAERLVQIEMAGVEAGVVGTGDAQDAVGVGLVGEGQAAGFVDDLDELVDVRVVDAGVFRVGHHDAGGALADRPLELLERRVALLVRHQGDHLEAGRRRGAGVAGVTEDGGDHLVALRQLAAGGVVGAHHTGVGVDGVRAAARVEADLVHAADTPGARLACPR